MRCLFCRFSKLPSFVNFLAGVVFGVISYCFVIHSYSIPFDNNFKDHYWSTNDSATKYDEFQMNQSLAQAGEKIIPNLMTKKVRLLCCILTNQGNHNRKVIPVSNTWAKRCNKFLFMSNFSDQNLSAINLKVKEGKDHLWGKTKALFKYVYDNFYGDYEWFMKADDDTYVIVENLRYFLLSQNPKEAMYHGCRFKPHAKEGFMSGGAGYVLSKEALRLFVEVAMKRPEKCNTFNDSGPEDVEMAKCLTNVGVKMSTSRDSENRQRFFHFAPVHHLTDYLPNHEKHWFWNYVVLPYESGMKCCSDRAISFHDIHPSEMYIMEYLIYYMRPFGLHTKFLSYNGTSIDDSRRTDRRALLSHSTHFVNYLENHQFEDQICN